jgi:hypothetical protein
MSIAMEENDNTQVETPPRARRTPPNVRWMALGALLIVAGVSLGDRLIVANIVEKNQALAEAYHAQDAKLAHGDELTEAEKSELRGSLLGDPLLLISVASMLLLLPLVVGAIVGRLTRSVRDTAIAVAVGMVAGFAVEGTGVLAIAIGAVVYLGLGALLGLLGKRLAARRTET